MHRLLHLREAQARATARRGTAFAAMACLIVAICASCGGGGGGSGSAGATSIPSAPANTTVSSPTDVLMYHNDAARTGQYLAETTLTPANVNPAHFGKIAFLGVDGKVDAQPLYVSSLTIGGKPHNVVYIATEHASVYAFDADTNTPLWQRSLLGSGETTSDDRNCQQITPEIGITATPVIDRTRGANGVLYAVAMSKDAGGAIHQRLHALDLTTGAEALGGPAQIAATYPGSGANSSNGVTVFGLLP